MSSDSDEDELLQMALEEQSRGASGKPSQKRNPAGKGGKSSRMVDDDDDSEVEMLSISSGDEDSGVRNVKSGGGGRGARGDDRGWEGGEPACWKNVDESELARRVRAMREARITPVVPKMEKKASGAGRKGLNSLLSIPRGMECIDPLGLGIIDQRSLRLITDSLDQSSQKDALDSSIREKLMFFSEEFDPKMFLARVHGGTCAADLETGANALRTDFKGRTQQRKQLVKENFDCFISCKNTIDDIEAKLRRIEEDPEGSGTLQLQKCIHEVASQANRAFEPLLERQAQAEKIRAVQGILQRFRTLFNLPSTIRGSIRKGEYDLAAREYKKAKSIGLPSHVGILKRVLEEVDKVMHEFKGTLYKTLEDPSIDSTHLESTLRLLVDLEPETDPVWRYLNIQNQRIRSLLEKCTSDHEARIEAMQFEKREKALSEAKWRDTRMDNTQFPEGNSDPLLDTYAYATELAGEELDALRSKYIRSLSAVVINLVPAFWRMAVAVFSGKFAKSSQVSAESNTNSASKTEEKVGEGKFSSHSLDEVSGMIRQTLSIYESKVHGTFQELEETNILHPYMNDCIKEISKASQALGGKESAPPVAVSALRMLHSEITKIYILRLCSWMRATTEEISNEETWVPVSILERNKSPYTISFMPLAFRSVLSSAMEQTSSMIQAIKSEAARSEDMFVQLREIQEAIRLAFLNCFMDFAAHLENIGADLAQSKYAEDNIYLQTGYSYGSEGKLTAELPGSITDPHQQLLIVLSNIGYCKDELTYELYGRFKPIWMHPGGKDEAEGDIQDLVISFTGLEEKVLEQYTVAKAHLIREAAMNYLLDSGVQWGSAPQVKGVRDAAVELLHSLVAVHAEVFAGAKPLLDKTLGILVEGLIDTFLSLFHENQDKELRTLDTNGFCQLMLELEYFEIILKPYFTTEARESLKSLQGVLLEKATESLSGGDDAAPEERQIVSPDDLIALAQQYTSELLQAELERTRINTACFVESIPFDTVPEPAKPPAYSASGNYRGATRR